MTILCACGCGDEFEPIGRQKVMPAHAHEYRNRMERERQRVYSAARKARGEKRQEGKSLPKPGKVVSTCPACGQTHQGSTKWEYCPRPRSCFLNRERSGGNEIYVSW